MSWNRKKVLGLISKDDQVLEADEYCMRTMSSTINNRLAHIRRTSNYMDSKEDEKDYLVIPAERVDSKTLAMVIDWCENHAPGHGKCRTPQELKAWDAEFIKGLDRDVQFKLSLAAKFLQIKELSVQMAKATVEFYKTHIVQYDVPSRDKSLFEPRPARNYDVDCPFYRYYNQESIFTAPFSRGFCFGP